MDSNQIVQEIRDLHDKMNRAEANIDQLYDGQRVIAEREIPSSVAAVSHRLTGALELLSDIASTGHKLAIQITSMNDRLTLLEQVIDADLPPEGNLPSMIRP